VRIIELLWEKERLTSGQIQKHCGDLSLACIAGTLDRLVKSGFVNRTIDASDSRVRYLYAPACTQEELGTKISEHVIDCLVDTFGTAVVSSIGRFRR
jgi:predicted transcriptional regulator